MAELTEEAEHGLKWVFTPFKIGNKSMGHRILGLSDYLTDTRFGILIPQYNPRFIFGNLELLSHEKFGSMHCGYCFNLDSGHIVFW